MQSLRVSNAKVRNLFVFMAMGAILWSAEEAEARIYPFAYLGGSTVKTVREEQDELLNTREIEKWRQGWSAGAGMRLLALQGDEMGAQRPRWEIRLKLAASGGEFEDVRVEFTRDREPIYQAVTNDTFEYLGFSLGGTALARVHPLIGFFAGPSIQRIKLKGDRNRTWEGTIPDFCGSCGPFEGDAEATVIYGLFEVGARFETDRTPAAIEIFWIPKRVQMSSTQTVDSDGYRADFADLASSVGLRFTYDF